MITLRMHLDDGSDHVKEFLNHGLLRLVQRASRIIRKVLLPLIAEHFFMIRGRLDFALLKIQKHFLTQENPTKTINYDVIHVSNA